MTPDAVAVLAMLAMVALLARGAAELRRKLRRGDLGERPAADPPPHPPADRAAHPRPPAPAPRSTGTGRALLGAWRVFGDVRAAGRGPGPYARRVLRRALFRAVRRW